MSDSMTRNRRSHNKKLLKRNKTLFSIAILVSMLLVIFLGYAVKQLTYNKVYNGIYINKIDVSGFTREELNAKIPELFDKRLSKDITLKIDNTEYTFDSLLLSPAIDTNSMTNIAFNHGREEHIFKRLATIRDLKKNPVEIPFLLTFDKKALQKIIDTAISPLDVTAIPNKIDYGDNYLIVTRGTAGNGVLFEEVETAVENCILNDISVADIDFKYIEPEKITYDYILRYTSDKPISADYTIKNNRIIYTESQPGVEFSKTDLEKALKNVNGTIVNIPAKITQPELTTEKLNEKLLAHELGKYSTDYSSSSNDRAYNIKLACEKINGYVLAPGEEFSYNDVVGPRTVERGFRMANVYVGNTVQPGIGGGICQVSSGLYNAVIFADLEITARRNHTLPVNYVPMGRDATVSYGSTDFKFKNNTSMPVEIRAIAENGINKIVIMGTDEHPERSIKIETMKTGSSSPKVIIEKDPELPEGKIIVEAEGTDGSSYVSYKVVYENDKEVSKTLLTKSTYKGKDRVEIHGTKKVEVPVTPEENIKEDENKVQEPSIETSVENTGEVDIGEISIQ